MNGGMFFRGGNVLFLHIHSFSMKTQSSSRSIVSSRGIEVYIRKLQKGSRISKLGGIRPGEWREKVVLPEGEVQGNLRLLELITSRSLNSTS